MLMKTLLVYYGCYGSFQRGYCCELCSIQYWLMVHSVVEQVKAGFYCNLYMTLPSAIGVGMQSKSALHHVTLKLIVSILL